MQSENNKIITREYYVERLNICKHALIYEKIWSWIMKQNNISMAQGGKPSQTGYFSG